ncbi:MAG: ABC transporter ATP-binding protein, partial [Oscillospiraceae bacterium]|nr:ABC transporter ATP-binding protein [Oscillospiraceae bacterium]
GKKVEGKAQSEDIRFLQDVPEFYKFMSAYEYLKFICELNNLTDIDTKIKETLELVGLSDAKNKRIGKFSRGMKQRIGIAASIIPNPKILLLDEPVSALDPMGRKEIFELLNKLRGKMTVVFSTHIIDDIERVSDKLIIINYGKKILDGSIAELKSKYATNIIELKFMNGEDKEKFVKSFNFKDFTLEDDEDSLRFKVPSLDIQSDIFKVLTDEKISILSLGILTPTLEEIFVEEVSK